MNADNTSIIDKDSNEERTTGNPQVGDTLKFVKENEMVKVCSYKGNVFMLEPPLFVELEITNTEPGFKGNTATGASKPAIVETGAQIAVPLFALGIFVVFDPVLSVGELYCHLTGRLYFKGTPVFFSATGEHDIPRDLEIPHIPIIRGKKIESVTDQIHRCTLTGAGQHT